MAFFCSPFLVLKSSTQIPTRFWIIKRKFFLPESDIIISDRLRLRKGGKS